MKKPRCILSILTITLSIATFNSAHAADAGTLKCSYKNSHADCRNKILNEQISCAGVQGIVGVCDYDHTITASAGKTVEVDCSCNIDQN